MTAESVIRGLGDVGALRAASEKAFQDEKHDHAADVVYLTERAERAETRVQELEAEIEASTAVDLLKRYRRVCVEKDGATRQIEAYMKDNDRGRLITALDILKGEL